MAELVSGRTYLHHLIVSSARFRTAINNTRAMRVETWKQFASGPGVPGLLFMGDAPRLTRFTRMSSSGAAAAAARIMT